MGEAVELGRQHLVVRLLVGLATGLLAILLTLSTVLSGWVVTVSWALVAVAIVVAGIAGGEATVKTFRKKGSTIALEPANPRLEPMTFGPGDDLVIYGKVVSVLRRL